MKIRGKARLCEVKLGNGSRDVNAIVARLESKPKKLLFRDFGGFIRLFERQHLADYLGFNPIVGSEVMSLNFFRFLKSRSETPSQANPLIINEKLLLVWRFACGSSGITKMGEFDNMTV
ncbi:MAG: hypothetical protein ACREFE_14115, partial [Limisphaerales bacterium]